MPNKNLKDFYRKKFYEKTSFEKKFNSNLFSIDAAETGWNDRFKTSLIHMLHEEGIIGDPDVDLKHLHSLIDKKYFVCETKGENNNSRPIISDIGFKFLDSNFDLYLDFLKLLYKDVIKDDFYFQASPTIRFHVPEYNKHLNLPAWHSDVILGHPPTEMNIWFSLTDNNLSDFWIGDMDNSRQWLEEYDFDFMAWKNICFSNNEAFNKRGFSFCKEVEDIGDRIFLFDSRCIHAATYRGLSDLTTKVSIDLRIILKKDYEWVEINNQPLYVGDGIKKAEFRPGHEFGYYHKSIEEMI